MLDFHGVRPEFGSQAFRKGIRSLEHPVEQRNRGFGLQVAGGSPLPGEFLVNSAALVLESAATSRDWAAAWMTSCRQVRP